MNKQKKDIYYKKDKYKLKYLQLKRQFVKFNQFGGMGNLYDPANKIISKELALIENKLYTVDGHSVGLFTNDLNVLEYQTFNALRIDTRNVFIECIEKKNKLQTQSNILDFINKCGIFVNSSTNSEGNLRFDFRLHIMANDFLIPISNGCIYSSQILRFVLAAVKRAIYRNIFTDYADQELYVARPYDIAPQNDRDPYNTILNDQFAEIFGLKPIPMISESFNDLYNPDNLRACIGNIPDQFTGRVIIFCINDSHNTVIDNLLRNSNAPEKNFNNIYVVNMGNFDNILREKTYSDDDIIKFIEKIKIRNIFSPQPIIDRQKFAIKNRDNFITKFVINHEYLRYYTIMTNIFLPTGIIKTKPQNVDFLLIYQLFDYPTYATIIAAIT